MPYMAVQCSSCGMLQVKEVRKTSSMKTWCCAICNQKQSVRKVYTTSDSAKDVRKFVQKFNLTMGLAAEAEALAGLEGTADTLEDSSLNYCDGEDEEKEEKLGKVWHGRERNSFECAQQLSPEEEQVCSWDIFQQSLNDDKLVTPLAEPPSHTRQTYSSRENSPPPRPPKARHGLSASGKLRNFIVTVSKDQSNLELDNSLRLKRAYDSGCDDNTQSCQSLNLSARPEIPPSALLASQTDCSPKGVKSFYTHVPGPKTSKWSKYLT